MRNSMACLSKIVRRLLNWYVIWFVLCALIFSLLLGLPVENYATMKEGFYPVVFLKVFLMVVVLLVFISKIRNTL